MVSNANYDNVINFEIVQASNALALATLSCVLKPDGDGHSLFCIRIKHES